jgi:hypothetical protein
VFARLNQQDGDIRVFCETGGDYWAGGAAAEEVRGYRCQVGWR